MSRFAIVVFLFCALAHAQQPKHQTVFFRSGDLNIEGYVFKPDGNGPFPALLYNHGSREGAERDERPFSYIASAFVPAGYVVFVVERRGYGKSDGATFSEEVQGARDRRYVDRLAREADDVLAATEYLRRQPYVDHHRVAIMGWSIGGIMTVLAVSRRADYCAAVDQAAGALSFLGSPPLQEMLAQAPRGVKVPLLSMVAENDATTAALATIDRNLPAATPHRGIVYPPFAPPAPLPNVAPGHMLFGPAGVPLWKSDVLAWLGQYCAPQK